MGCGPDGRPSALDRLEQLAMARGVHQRDEKLAPEAEIARRRLEGALDRRGEILAVAGHPAQPGELGLAGGPERRSIELLLELGDRRGDTRFSENRLDPVETELVVGRREAAGGVEQRHGGKAGVVDARAPGHARPGRPRA